MNNTILYHMNIYIPAGGSAHSITVSARAVSPMQSRLYIIFLTFIGSVLCIKCSLALAALLLLSSGMLRLRQRTPRPWVFSNTNLAFSGVRGSAVGRDDDIITTTHTYTATVEATNHHVIMSLMGQWIRPHPSIPHTSPFSGGVAYCY